MDSTWRVGRHQPRNLYVGEVMVGVMVGLGDDAAVLAAAVVRAMNATAEPEAARVCKDCGRTARQLVPGADGGWRGPACHRRWLDGPRPGEGFQLPITPPIPSFDQERP